jgi:hypothetical protein
MDVVIHVQEIVIQIINVTLEKQVIGEYINDGPCHLFPAYCILVLDLFDAMFSLVDIFTFTLRTITPSMWPVFEIMYKLFKSTAIDYLDGGCYSNRHIPNQLS